MAIIDGFCIFAFVLIMKTSKKYTLQLASLNNGIHHFKFLVDDAFFTLFPFSPVNNGDIEVHVTMNKQDHILLFDFSINGTINVPCDRCSEDFDLIISGTNKLLVKLGNEYREEDDEVIIIPKNESELDLSQYIYEFILLLVPMKIVHPDNEDGNPQCNPDLLEILKNYQPKDKSPDEQDETDPRWNKLKGFHDN